MESDRHINDIWFIVYISKLFFPFHQWPSSYITRYLTFQRNDMKMLKLSVPTDGDRMVISFSFLILPHVTLPFCVSLFLSRFQRRYQNKGEIFNFWYIGVRRQNDCRLSSSLSNVTFCLKNNIISSHKLCLRCFAEYVCKSCAQLFTWELLIVSVLLGLCFIEKLAYFD